MDDTVTRHDYQEIKIQENTQILGVGVIPRSILVVLKDDLVDNVKAGGIKTPFPFVLLFLSINASMLSLQFQDALCIHSLSYAYLLLILGV